METLTTRRPPIVFLILAGVVFLLLAVLEVIASHAGALEPDPAAPWTAHLRQVDEALARRDLDAAARAWHQAYGAARGSRRWEGMIEAGDAARRIGEAAGTPKHGVALARRLYRDALLRARHQGSVEGVLRAGQAFSSLGDRDVMDLCLRMAERLAKDNHDGEALTRVEAFRQGN